MTQQQEIEIVKQLGDQIGYGHLMSLASALWRQTLKEKGYPTNTAEKDTIKQQLGCQSMNDLDFLTYIRQNSLHRKFMTLLGM